MSNQNSSSLGWVNVQVDETDPASSPTMIRYDQFVDKLFKKESFKEMALHAALGLCGEAGELGDAVKKHVVYGKEVDRDNIVEELGDIRFFLQAVMNLYGISETEVLQTNGYKLAKRYAGLAYTAEAAIARADKIEPEPKYVHRAWDEKLGQWVLRDGKEPGREQA